jgi:hypothetical protein
VVSTERADTVIGEALRGGKRLELAVLKSIYASTPRADPQRAFAILAQSGHIADGQTVLNRVRRKEAILEPSQTIHGADPQFSVVGQVEGSNYVVWETVSRGECSKTAIFVPRQAPNGPKPQSALAVDLQCGYTIAF